MMMQQTLGVSRLKESKCKKKISCSLFVIKLYSTSKDVRLPIQLQRAMATEAEAAREARAKVKSLNKIKRYKWQK